MTLHHHYMIRIKALIISFLLPLALLAQDSAFTHQHTFYTFVYNEVPDNFHGPLVGIVNAPLGNQKGVQLGFTNLNKKQFHGAQIGLTNTIGGSGRGVQVGLVNACRGRFTGTQVGYVNVATADVKGAQVGYVNVAAGKVQGAQVAFVNIRRDSIKPNEGDEATGRGAQLGFVNVSAGSLKGAQVGYVNIAARSLYGTQIGFVNVADSITKGIPLGFISIVRHGGFKVIEAGYSGMYPASLSVKFGVTRFYTFLTASYNPDLKNEFAAGLGLGTIAPISQRFFFNAEAMSLNTFQRKPLQLTAISTTLGATLGKHWSIVAGPDITWSYQTNLTETKMPEPAFSFYSKRIDSYNRLHVGAKAALRFHFN